MKFSRTLFPIRPIVTAFATAAIGMALANPAISQIAVQGNVLGTPDDGMICRTGFAGDFNAGNLKCSKSRFFFVSLTCDERGFTTYVVRPSGSPGTREGRDICTRGGGVRISSSDDVSQLNVGQDYVFAKIGADAIATETARLDQEEATALGLNAARDVDSVAGEPVIQPHPETGAKDRAVVQLMHYTFAIPTARPVAAARR